MDNDRTSPPATSSEPEPGVKHWHGGTADTAMTHIAIQGLVDGTPVHWMEHVTDEEYLK